jgi:FAD/FMN-containing dehydrogenase
MNPHFSTSPEKLQHYAKDMVYAGHPQYIYESGDDGTTRDVLAYCHAEKLPVTFCGSQTSMTGSSVADDGVALALGKRNQILDIGFDKEKNFPFVVTEPGVILGDLKREVEKAGFFYPPDPTSFNEAQVGATVATNATGEDTFKYGPTRHYVDELEVICSDGKIKNLKRQNNLSHNLKKNLAGYFIDGEEIDEVIGSEGTLALISKIKLRLLPLENKKVFVLVLPFSDFAKSIQAVTWLTKINPKPRALELIGPGAVDYFSRSPECPEELKNQKAFLYLKEEYRDEADFEKKLSGLFDELKKIYADVGDTSFLDQVFVAKTDKQLAALRTCRHYIPLKVNEEYFPFVEQGGGKVGTDWWVPIPHLYAMMGKTYDEACVLGIPFLVFAHIGNGHPHWNFLTRTAEEKTQAKEFVLRQCREAVSYGGGVAGEHGLGKIKRDLLAVQHSPKVIREMMALKARWDPHGILGRGNIFPLPAFANSAKKKL